MLYILIALLLVSCSANAQPDSLWSRTYGYSGSEYCSDALQTADGGFLLVGRTPHDVNLGLDPDGWVIKTDENGDSLWTRRFGGVDSDEFWTACQTSDGGYLLGGKTVTYGANWKSDFWVVRLSVDGDSLWSRTYGGDDFESIYAIQHTSDGGFMLAGNTNSFGSGNSDFWLVKTDGNGDSLWSRTYGTERADNCWSACQSSDGGYLLFGSRSSQEAGSLQFFLLKADENGDSLWSRTLGGDRVDEGRAVIETEDGGIALAGYTSSFSDDLDFDIWLAKTDSDGNILWSRTYGDNRSETCHSLSQSADGGFVLGGNTRVPGEGDDYLILKTDSQGDSLWSRVLGGMEDELCSRALETTDGGYVMAGRTSSYGAGMNDFWLVKLGTISTAEVVQPFPHTFTLFPPHPNPFNSSVSIPLELSKPQLVDVRIYNLLGQEVYNFGESLILPGRQVLAWDGISNSGIALSTGTYIIEARVSGKIVSSKVHLVR